MQQSQMPQYYSQQPWVSKSSASSLSAFSASVLLLPVVPLSSMVHMVSFHHCLLSHCRCFITERVLSLVSLSKQDARDTWTVQQSCIMLKFRVQSLLYELNSGFLGSMGPNYIFTQALCSPCGQCSMSTWLQREKGHFENPKFGRPSYSTFFKMASRCFVPILLLQLVRTIILTTVAIIIPSHRLILFIVGVFFFHPALCSLCVTCCHYNQNGCHNLLTTCDLTGALCLSGNRPTNGNERAGCGKSETV